MAKSSSKRSRSNNSSALWQVTYERQDSFSETKLGRTHDNNENATSNADHNNSTNNNITAITVISVFLTILIMLL